MANTITSSNMNLVIPVTGVDPGPDWANNLNASLLLVDAHDHSSGKGVLITPSGINISSDLSFNSHNTTGLRSARFVAQGSPISGASDLGCLYVSGVDLYYNDENGNQIQITASGGVAGSPGSIANLTSPASASYVSLSDTFVWQSAANTPANMDGASFIFRNLSASSKGLTLNPPAAMAANYSITLPSLPGSTKIMSLDSSGNMGATYGVDNSTLDISANNLEVKAGGVGTTQLASSSVTTAKIADANVTRPKLVSVGEQTSSSSASFSSSSTSATDVTNLHVSITTTGRPVIMRLQPVGTGTTATLQLTKVTQTTTRVNILFLRDSTTLAIYRLGFASADLSSMEFAPELSFIDGPGAGTYTYKVQVQIVSSDGTIAVTNCVIVAYEL